MLGPYLPFKRCGDAAVQLPQTGFSLQVHGSKGAQGRTADKPAVQYSRKDPLENGHSRDTQHSAHCACIDGYRNTFAALDDFESVLGPMIGHYCTDRLLKFDWLVMAIELHGV